MRTYDRSFTAYVPHKKQIIYSTFANLVGM